MFTKRFRKPLAFVLALVLLLAVGAGCGPADTTEPTGEPLVGGTVTVAITQEPNTLNPFTAEAAGDKEILFNIYEGLLKPDSDGVMHGALASHYDMSEDARTYTFTHQTGCGVPQRGGHDPGGRSVFAEQSRGTGRQRPACQHGRHGRHRIHRIHR